MSYDIRFDSDSQNDLLGAATYYITVHPESTAYRFYDLTYAAFAKVQKQPDIAPAYNSNGRKDEVFRRINVWRFAVVYRVDHAGRFLIITRIIRERAEGV